MKTVPTKQDDQYFQCYKRMYNLLVSAYKDVFIIEQIGKQKDEIPKLGKSIFETLAHICELAKADLCLALWKTSIDNDGHAATVEELKKIVRERGFLVSDKKFSIMAKHIEKDIEKIRNTYIAHADRQHFEGAISVNFMRDRLNSIRDMLNDMCFPQLDSRVELLDDAKVNVISFHVITGIGVLIDSASEVLGMNQEESR